MSALGHSVISRPTWQRVPTSHISQRTQLKFAEGKNYRDKPCENESVWDEVVESNVKASQLKGRLDAGVEYYIVYHSLL